MQTTKDVAILRAESNALLLSGLASDFRELGLLAFVGDIEGRVIVRSYLNALVGVWK
jgi:hypothetical protein